MKKTIILSTLIALAGALLTAVPAGAAVSGGLEAVFTNPSVGGTADSAALDRVTTLIDAAATGTTVRVALGTDIDQTIADHLLSAQDQRSVTVLAVAESCPSGTGTGCTAPSARLSALAAAMPAGRFTWCAEGCLTAAGVLARNSFLVFDGLADGRTDVVVQPGGNLSASARLQRDDILVSANDTALATGYRAYFGKLVAGTPATFTGSVAGAGGKTDVFFHPRAGTEDVLANAVNDVQCPGGTVLVSAAVFSAGRTALVDALTAKRTAGCTVRVIMPDRNDALPALGAGAVQVTTYRPGGCRMPAGGSCTTGSLGSSYVLVDGVSTKAGTAKKLVWAGTARYTSTKDDATILKIDDPTIYAAYLADWNKAYSNAVVLQSTQWPYAETGSGNSNASGDQDFAQMAFSRNGNLAVVWEDDKSGDDPEDNIHTQIFIRMIRNGATVYEKAVSTGGTGNWKHLRPDVAVDNSGNAVVTWLADPDGNGVFNIDAVYISAAGTIGTTVQANADSTGQQMYPAVAIDPDGGTGAGYVVTWEDRRTDPSQIRAAAFSTGGTKRYEVAVSASTTAGGSNRLPDVGLDALGNAYIVWQEDRDGNGYFNIALRVLTAAGANKVSQKAVNSDGNLQQVDPSIAVNAAGTFVVAWRGDQTGTIRAYFRTFNSAATALIADDRRAISDAEATGEPFGAQAEPKAGIDDSGNVVVAWMETGYAGAEPWARGFNKDGTTTGRFPPARMSVFTAGKQAEVTLAVSPYGEFSVGYTDDRDGNGWDQIELRNGFNNSLW